ncbi:MAG: hypothetical protein HY275_08915 [Gemmatimonadetes bacterium]|nr:hypothetical protein [Gemmatimonadota bacterium]
MRRARVLPLLALTALAASCSRPPTRDELNSAQMANDMAEAVAELRNGNAELRASLDSLARVVARQDTLVRQLANLAGVTVPPR